MAKSTAIEVTDNLMARIQNLPEIKAETPEEIQAKMLERIFSSASLDEMLGQQGTTAMEDIEGEVVKIHDCHFNESSIKGQNGFYAVIDVELNDKRISVTSGSRTVMAMVLHAKEQDWLPFECRFVKSPTPTQSGFYPWWLEPAAATRKAEADGEQPVEEPF